MKLPQSSYFAMIPLLTLFGCVSISPQEVDLTALRVVLPRVGELPDTWLDDSGVTDLGCRGNNISKIFRTTYRKRVGGKTVWFVETDVLVFCSEAPAFQYLERLCKRGWPRSSRAKERMEIFIDEFGMVCISSIVQLRNHGLIPSNTFRSHVGLQSGTLVVKISESHRRKPGSAKQIAIDDLTTRLLKAIEQGDAQRAAPPL